MAAAFCAWRLVRVDVPAMPAAAYLASMSLPGAGPVMGVSGGGGEPRVALVVDVDAVELKRWMPWSGCRLAEPGAGQYCWWKSGYGLTSPCLPGRDVPLPADETPGCDPALVGAFWKRPSLSGVAGPGESGSGLGRSEAGYSCPPAEPGCEPTRGWGEVACRCSGEAPLRRSGYGYGAGALFCLCDGGRSSG